MRWMLRNWALFRATWRGVLPEMSSRVAGQGRQRQAHCVSARVTLPGASTTTLITVDGQN